MAVKFADDNEGGPFDMILQTGKTSVFWNLLSFEDRLDAALAKDTVKAQYEWVRQKPVVYAGSIDSLRRFIRFNLLK